MDTGSGCNAQAPVPGVQRFFEQSVSLPVGQVTTVAASTTQVCVARSQSSVPLQRLPSSGHGVVAEQRGAVTHDPEGVQTMPAPQRLGS